MLHILILSHGGSLLSEKCLNENKCFSFLNLLLYVKMAVVFPIL